MGEALVPILEGIRDELVRKRINTGNLLDEKDIDKKVLKVIRDSHLVDMSWNEIIKAKAIVNPSEYIADRAEAIRETNTNIAKELNEYYKKLTPVDEDGNPLEDRLPENKIKELLQRRLLTSAVDHYAEVNTKYPISNLATSLQNAINTSKLVPGEASKSRKGRKRKK